MTSYRILADDFASTVTVEDDHVISALPPLKHYNGKPWVLLRNHADEVGWIIKPQLDSSQRILIECGGFIYEVFYHYEVIRKIVRHSPSGERRQIDIEHFPANLRHLL